MLFGYVQYLSPNSNIYLGNLVLWFGQLFLCSVCKGCQAHCINSTVSTNNHGIVWCWMWLFTSTTSLIILNPPGPFKSKPLLEWLAPKTAPQRGLHSKSPSHKTIKYDINWPEPKSVQQPPILRCLPLSRPIRDPNPRSPHDLRCSKPLLRHRSYRRLQRICGANVPLQAIQRACSLESLPLHVR